MNDVKAIGPMFDVMGGRRNEASELVDRIAPERFGKGKARILRKLVLLAIATSAAPDGTAKPSRETLAHRCLVSLRAIDKVVDWLVKNGLLGVEYKAGWVSKQGRTNRYTILFDPTKHGAIEVPSVKDSAINVHGVEDEDPEQSYEHPERWNEHPEQSKQHPELLLHPNVGVERGLDRGIERGRENEGEAPVPNAGQAVLHAPSFPSKDGANAPSVRGENSSPIAGNPTRGEEHSSVSSKERPTASSTLDKAESQERPTESESTRLKLKQEVNALAIDLCRLGDHLLLTQKSKTMAETYLREYPRSAIFGAFNQYYAVLNEWESKHAVRQFFAEEGGRAPILAYLDTVRRREESARAMAETTVQLREQAEAEYAELQRRDAEEGAMAEETLGAGVDDVPTAEPDLPVAAAVGASPK